jgi:hypothetical protein
MPRKIASIAKGLSTNDRQSQRYWWKSSKREPSLNFTHCFPICHQQRSITKSNVTEFLPTPPADHALSPKHLFSEHVGVQRAQLDRLSKIPW